MSEDELWINGNLFVELNQEVRQLKITIVTTYKNYSQNGHIINYLLFSFMRFVFKENVYFQTLS
jgi:hypothetical protein